VHPTTRRVRMARSWPLDDYLLGLLAHRMAVLRSCPMTAEELRSPADDFDGRLRADSQELLPPILEIV
jgi:hypothetical protein